MKKDPLVESETDTVVEDPDTIPMSVRLPTRECPCNFRPVAMDNCPPNLRPLQQDFNIVPWVLNEYLPRLLTMQVV